MIRAALGRVGALLSVLLFLSVVVFLVQSVLPGDPVRAFFGRNASLELIAQKTAELGYDRPLWEQYLLFLGRIATGDLGDSLSTHRPVATDLAAFLPATLELAFVASLLALVGGVALGTLSAGRPRSALPLRIGSIAASSAPAFFVALLLVLLFYRTLRWLPQGGRISGPAPDGPTGFHLIDTLLAGDLAAFGSAVEHLALPAVTLAIVPAVAIGRTLRSALSSTLRKDFIRTARAKGLREGAVILRHGLRNSASPVLSMAGLQLALLLAGAITVEVVFAWPGVGLYLFQAIRASDFPAIIAVVLVLGIGYVVVNALVDLLQLWADPVRRRNA